MSGKSKKIAVKVFIVRDETEEIEVESRTLETPTLTTIQNTIKNNFSEVLAYEGKHKKVYILRAETEELAVHKQNTEDDDTQDLHHHHHQEQARRV